MKQNKTKVTWKAILAVVLVIAALISMSAVVSAGFVEFILGDEEAVAANSSLTSTTTTSPVHVHTFACEGWVTTTCKLSRFVNGIAYCTGDYAMCTGGLHSTQQWAIICGQSET